MKVGVLEFMDTYASLPPAVLFIYYYKVGLTNGRELNWTEKILFSKDVKEKVNIDKYNTLTGNILI